MKDLNLLKEMSPAGLRAFILFYENKRNAALAEVAEAERFIKAAKEVVTSLQTVTK